MKVLRHVGGLAGVEEAGEDTIAGNPVIFVLGGARSGKSRFAEGLLATLPSPWTYVATAQAFDGEMTERIALHRARRDERWQTVDAPHALPATLDAHPDRPVLVDCLTLWLTNRMLAEADLASERDGLLRCLRARTTTTVLVANEVGLGIVPDTPLGRRFRDEAGLLNQAVAVVAGTVHFVAAGLPLRLK